MSIYACGAFSSSAATGLLDHHNNKMEMELTFCKLK